MIRPHPAAFLLFLATALHLVAQTPTPERTGERSLEARVAAVVDHLRAQDHLRPLTRIIDRSALQQLTCSAAHNGSASILLLHTLSLEAQAAGAITRTTDPSHLPPELAAIAAYDDHGADPSRRIARYAVAVWPDPQTPGVYWVGLALYWSRLRQAIAIHITHNYKPPDLRPALAPACLSVH